MIEREEAAELCRVIDRGCERREVRCAHWYTYPYNVCLGCGCSDIHGDRYEAGSEPGACRGILATLLADVEENEQLTRVYPLLKAEHDANQAAADAFSFAGPNSRAFKQAKAAIGEAHNRAQAVLKEDTNEA